MDGLAARNGSRLRISTGWLATTVWGLSVKINWISVYPFNEFTHM